jgi:hypothetical protein
LSLVEINGLAQAPQRLRTSDLTEQTAIEAA